MTGATDQPHIARKRFGQNFLHDHNVIQRIVKSIHLRETDVIIEIGPGLGALTKHLLSATPHVAAVELDRDLAARLREEFPQLALTEGDALKTDFAGMIAGFGGKKAKIVGNLPYNISTPLIFHLLAFKDVIDSMYFMLQREVVERMAANPHNKSYGKLSVMTQYHCDVSPLFHISPQCFRPVPKVESTLIQLKPRPFTPMANNVDFFEKVVSTAFQQRRKTLRNALGVLLPKEPSSAIIEKLSLRAEDLSVADYVTLSNEIAH